MNIGLKDSYKSEMTEKLNSYLSNIQIAYMNTRGYHWNVTGKQFFALHAKFEELYNRLNEMADEIAERILMLGGKPVHSFSEYIKISSIKERLNVSSTEDTVKALLEDTGVLLAKERELLSLASDNDDEATANILTEYIQGQEKMIWMFSAFLK
ncbi:MAG TPA: Dps family protein [Bacteroidales bacterium]|nr:Dps family protein [Bacteroidales bacterium]